MLRSRLAVLLTLLCSLSVLPAAPRAALAQGDDGCFVETDQCISGRFRSFWEQNGGLAIFGYPISRADQERNPDTGQNYLTQWMERNRFELHPENAAPYDVLLGRLGADALERQGRNWHAEGREPGPQAGCLWFEQTGHNVCDFDATGASAADRGFLSYWQAEGLADPQLDAYQRSLALHGLPLTAPRMETNSSGDTVMTQWFERSRMEWHPDNPAGFRMLLGLLGNELRGAPLPADVPWVQAGGRVVALAEGRPAVAPAGGVGLASGSPDGRYLFYTTGTEPVNDRSETRLVLRDVVTGFEVTVYVGYELVFGAVWSPDDQLAFNLYDAADRLSDDLRIVDAASGTVRTVLLNVERTPLPLAWTSEGIFFTGVVYSTRGIGEAPRGLTIVNPTTGSVTEISDAEHYGVAVNPGGRLVAFVGGTRERPGSTTDSSELLVLDRDTGVRTTAVPRSEDVLFTELHWSPDNSKLVYVRVPGDSTRLPTLHVINADGSGEQILPFGPPELGVLSDVAWRDSNTLQLLMNRRIGTTVEDTSQLGEVLEISLDAFTPAQVRRVAEIPGGAGFFVYQPR